MNGQTSLDIIKLLITACSASLIAGVVAMYVARRSAAATEKAALIAAQTNASIKAVDGLVVLKTTEVQDRTAWEARVLDQYERLDKKMMGLEALLDTERGERRKLETALHLSDLKITDLEKEVGLLQATNEKLAKENRKRQTDCEEQIRRLQEELRTICGERDDLKARLLLIEAAKHIGGIEVAEKDTKKRIQQVEQKLDNAADALHHTEAGTQTAL